jgi:hypothetical protein
MPQSVGNASGKTGPNTSSPTDSEIVNVVMKSLSAAERRALTAVVEAQLLTVCKQHSIDAQLAVKLAKAWAQLFNSSQQQVQSARTDNSSSLNLYTD